MAKYWQGAAPTHCDICKRGINSVFYDAATKTGAWAIMCVRCNLLHGKGLGMGAGLGQLYARTGKGWEKTAG